MRTLTKILEKIGEHYAWATWMYGAPVPRPPFYPRGLGVVGQRRAVPVHVAGEQEGLGGHLGAGGDLTARRAAALPSSRTRSG
jgi:hypothetical protein